MQALLLRITRKYFIQALFAVPCTDWLSIRIALARWAKRIAPNIFIIKMSRNKLHFCSNRLRIYEEEKDHQTLMNRVKYSHYIWVKRNITHASRCCNLDIVYAVLATLSACAESISYLILLLGIWAVPRQGCVWVITETAGQEQFCWFSWQPRYLCKTHEICGSNGQKWMFGALHVLLISEYCVRSWTSLH